MKSYALSLVFCLLLAFPMAAAATRPDNIRIGATVSMTGKYAEPSAMIREAFKLWEHEVNARGGLLGRKVDLLLYDDQSDVARVGELYRKLIEDDKVDLVFSPYGTPLTLEASRISEQHGFVMLSCGAAGTGIWQRGFHFVFGVYAPAQRMFIGLLDLMAQNGMNRLSLMYDQSSSFDIDVVKGVREWAAKFKIDLVDEQPYRDGKRQIPSILKRFKEKNAAAVLVSAYPPDDYEVMRILAKMNYKPRVLSLTIAPAQPDFERKAGAIADRVFCPSQWEPDERIPFPGTKQFVQAFTAFTGHLPSYHAGTAYAACQLYEQAIKATRSLDNRRIRDHLASMDTVTVIGRFKVDRTGMQVGQNPIIIQWQNGRKEIVWPRKMQTARPIMAAAGAE
jgi:branched-chain amino acid transport system substrate-binding protein